MIIVPKAGLLNNAVNAFCGSDPLTEHLGNLSKIIADKSLRVAFKNNYIFDITAEIPFILGGFLVFANGDFLVSDIHGVEYGVITDHSFVVHIVLLINRAAPFSRVPPFEIISSCSLREE